MHGHAPDCRTNHDAQGLPAPAAVLHPVHVRVLPRSGQSRLRRADDEQGSRVQRLSFWAGRRRLLRRLLSLRSAEQPDAREGRRPVLARPHHDHLGALFRGDGVCQWSDQLCDPALSARRRRGRLLSRHPVLFPLLVSGAPPRADDLVVHRGDTDFGRARRTDFDRAVGTRRHLWSCRVEMGVPRRGGACRDPRLFVAHLSQRPARTRLLADPGRKGLDRDGARPRKT